MPLHVDYYVSLNSPWTHLGAARIEAMCAEARCLAAHLAGRFRRHLPGLRRPCPCRGARRSARPTA